MILYCAVCGRGWRRVRDTDANRKHPRSCPGCRSTYRARRKGQRAPVVSDPDPLPYRAIDLEQLMREADAAAARALELARRLKP